MRISHVYIIFVHGLGDVTETLWKLMHEIHTHAHVYAAPLNSFIDGFILLIYKAHKSSVKFLLMASPAESIRRNINRW
jgi:hypothetical protein